MSAKMVLMVPFTGLGMYGGFRGNRWLRNRIAVFERFVIPSILNQTDRDFVVWLCWRKEERNNRYVKELKERLSQIPNFRFVFTYTGVPMWDDKYEDAVARERLFDTLKDGLPELFDYLPDCDEVYWLMQPSDDLYDRMTVESVKLAFGNDPTMQAVTYLKGFICNYTTKEVKEYNPKTNPPFAAIRFPRNTFFDPGKHMTYISLKQDVGKYKQGTPLPSHEYLPHCLKTAIFDGRGFMVGTHGENISTHFNHPYGQNALNEGELQTVYFNFGIGGVKPIKLPLSFRKWLMRKLPHRWQRKLRYWFGELLYNRFYNWIRN